MRQAAYLLGFRAAGKTTLGRKLAAENGWEFLDLDEEWEKRRGQSILRFVEEEGIESFRREEEALLRETEERLLQASATPLLVATGGGVVDGSGSRELLQKSPWPKIFLDPGAKELWRRLEPVPERRKIGGLESFGALEALHASRHREFEKIASYSVKKQDITQALIELNRYLQSLWPGA